MPQPFRNIEQIETVVDQQENMEMVKVIDTDLLDILVMCTLNMNEKRGQTDLSFY